jgi:hypothetical protein
MAGCNDRTRAGHFVAALIALVLLAGVVPRGSSDAADDSAAGEPPSSASVSTTQLAPTSTSPEPESQRRYEFLDSAQLAGRAEANSRPEGCGETGQYRMAAASALVEHRLAREEAALSQP